MSAAYDHKTTYLSDLAQVILLNEKGELTESCNTLIDVATYDQKSLFGLFPILESIYPVLLDLKDNKKDRLYLPRVEFKHNKKEWIFDFLFYKKEIKNQQAIIWILQDLTNQYKYLLKVQQERNESIIERELLADKNKALKLEKEIEKRNQVYKVKLKYSTTISQDLQPSAKKIEQTLTKLQKYAQKQPELTSLASTIKHINKVLLELLDQSKLSLKHHPSPPVIIPPQRKLNPFSLKDVTRVIARIFDYQQTKKTIPFLIRIEPNTTDQLYGSATKLAHIIYNISKNLLKINDSGKVILTISEEKKSSKTNDNKKVLHFEIKNVQTSFDKKILNKVLQFNLSSTQKEIANDDITNMQMEIAIAQKLLELQNQTLQIQSTGAHQINFSFKLSFQKQ